MKYAQITRKHESHNKNRKGSEKLQSFVWCLINAMTCFHYKNTKTQRYRHDFHFAGTR
jgi:hypothetical protein